MSFPSESDETPAVPDRGAASEVELPDALPPALRDALAACTSDIAPSSGRDLELRAEAHRHLRRGGRGAAAGRRVVLRRVAAGLATAAAVAMLVLLVPPGHRGPARDPLGAADVDGDGRVDMLDAFSLARRLADGRPTSLRHDLDGSGDVDAADVEAVARRAVLLDRAAASETEARG